MWSVELFTGAGGLALGTHRAGFRHLAVVELNHDACETLRLNCRRQAMTGADWRVIETDVRTLDYSAFPKHVDLLAGGAPCQPFSLGGKHAGETDPRNMFPEVFRAVAELQPRAFLLENVRGLTRESFLPYFEYIISRLRFPCVLPEPGEGWEEHKARLDEHLVSSADRNFSSPEPTDVRYDVKYKVIDVADFGVPQRRHRVFIVGFRRDLAVKWSFPERTHSQDALLYAQYVDESYWDEHGLKPRPVPERFAKRVAILRRMPKPMERRWRTVRDAISDLPEPVNYDKWPPLDNHSGIPDARAYKGHTGSLLDWPAKAIKAGDHGNPGGENMLRRSDGSVRYFTVRELARLQAFPDEWHFSGPWSETRRQLGNAVPVVIAEQLAAQIRHELLRVDQRVEIRKPELTLASAD
ncbi:DNA cytosine methyltransferase [Nitrolancea hollandica]|uniref:DNA (cytosine-5-)-methyltransferase n=1 Tax=Nitrolancea hollandica Lb TaxID=1129897 RepID=I4EN65_9BACT|nr:DNA cytosine methyltransferase [Nitrolancea hollandica]CCF86128.1 Cytosine-specific methyltransferase [Nitrolancea hollandica Lb]